MPDRITYDHARCGCPDCGGALPGWDGQLFAGESAKPTPWAVICRIHGRVYLTHHEYTHQMRKPYRLWTCPRGGTFWTPPCPPAEWDDETEEAAMEQAMAEDWP